MKYQVQQISYDYRTFDDIKASTWIFTTSEIHTDKGKLDILDFQEVEQNGQVGVQMSVEGWLDLGQYNSSSPLDGSINVRTLAIMRKPHNVWLWVYMFDECDRPIAAFCGTDGFDESNSFARYVQELHHKTHVELNIPPTKYEEKGDFQDVRSVSVEEKVTGRILEDGQKYSGWGYNRNGKFFPHGCGKKYYPDFYVYGNFVKGNLNGPAINSHNRYMYTMFFNNNRGYGWGLCINGGYLMEFGYYQNSRLKVDLTDFVQWYYEGKLSKSERSDENMMSMYTSKDSKEVTTLLIGYAPKKISENVTLACMGFRFKANGSVWVGTGNLSQMTGNYIHFRADGCIDIGRFDDGKLIERMSLQELIDNYFGTYEISEDDLFSSIFCNHSKSPVEIERESDREKYRNISEPKVDYNYFENKYNSNDDLPF